MFDVVQRYKNLLEQIASAQQKFHRTNDEIRIVAASKQQSVPQLFPLIALGQRSFGENYLQEALPKISATLHETLEWHFIGRIQSNKTKQIASSFDWVQTIDNLKQAQLLNEYRSPTRPPLNICLQVNIDLEATKSGISADRIATLAEQVSRLPRLKLRGIMAIPARQPTFDLQRATFSRVYKLYESLKKSGFSLDTLSMGMSEDLTAAIAEGSTMLRVGTVIFGSRL